MPLADNFYYYIVYGVILVAFLIVLKAPKKNKDKSTKSNNEDK